jgi:CubicO group peptidase (beta-lactamase class C family)
MHDGAKTASAWGGGLRHRHRGHVRRGFVALLLTAATAMADGSRELAEALDPILRRHDVPALAGAIVTTGGLDRAAAAGVRRRGSEIAATTNDLWHLGSCTKAMTALLLARLAEKGGPGWETPLPAVFRGASDSFHPGWTNVTLRHLVEHRAGLPANLRWASFGRGGTPVADPRVAVVREALSTPPRSPPGSVYEYSNLGYVIAGAAAELTARAPWEEAIRREVLDPLGMRRTGFGGTGTPGDLDQPWGHTEDGRPVRRNGPDMDNPPVLGPAGRVHATLHDWALFVADQLRGARGEPALLPAAACRSLHTPALGGTYAAGWETTDRPWGGGTVLTHAGCNTMNYAVAWLAPLRGFAVLVCVNQAGDRAAKAADEAASALIRLHLASGTSERSATRTGASYNGTSR